MDVVACSITIGTLAASVAKSVVKLKACWEAIQDAPEDVHFLVKRVEVLSLILRDMQDDQTQNPVSNLLLDGSTVSTCLETCKAAANRLGQLANKMATSIESSRQLRRKWASVRIVVKKNTIEKFEAELQSCISLLQLSHETYTRALLRLQPSIIHAKILQALPSGASPTPIALQDHQTRELAPIFPSEATSSKIQSSGTQSYHTFWQSLGSFNVLGSLRVSRRSYQKKNTKESDSFQNLETYEEVRALYRGPAWLVNRAWAFHAVKAYNGWDCYFRQYNILPSNSPVFMHAETGNVAGLRKLFEESHASPWDCDGNGWTPLHYAVFYSQFSACKLLLQFGADNNYRNNVGISPTEFAINNLLHSRFHKNEEAVNLSRMLMMNPEVDPSFLRFYRGPVEGFTLWQQSLNPQYYEIALEERVEMAIAICRSPFFIGPALLSRALTRDHIPRLAVGMRNSKGQTLLHTVAHNIGELAHYMFRNPRVKSAYEENLAGWRSILGEIICKGADLHSTDSASHTPFTSFLSTMTKLRSEDGVLASVDTLDTWLGDLRDCGVDLYEYGRREEEIYQENNASRELDSWVLYIHCGIWKLVSFIYGSSPNDWRLQLEWRPEERDEHGQQVQEIPGSWVED